MNPIGGISSIESSKESSIESNKNTHTGVPPCENGVDFLKE